MTVELHLGDCLEIMKAMPDESVDLVLTDPPFNVGKRYGTSDNRKDYPSWCADWIAECFRITKKTGVISIKNIVRNLPLMFLEMGKHGSLINQVIWRNTSANHSKGGFWNDYESILIYSKSSSFTFNTYAQTQPMRKPSWNKDRRSREKGQMRDIWDDITRVYTGSVVHPEAVLMGDGTKKKLHPCQQPIDLSVRQILFLSNAGDTILDPFMGIGTTGVACVKNSRGFVGIEINERYFLEAQDRIGRI